MAEVQAKVPAEAVSVADKSHGVDKDVLIARLDTLLETYLHTLDEYEKLMQQLSKKLSSGFLSLTQANFHNRSGLHYGQDSYDERVQATRKIVVTEDAKSNFQYSTISTQLPAPKAAQPTTPASDQEKGQEKDSPEPPGSPTETPENTTAPETPSSPQTNPPQDTEESNDPPNSTTSTDPIRMFGILVPPALRAAQTSFQGAVEGPLVRLAGVVGELRALEREIGRARKGVRRA